ncbi:PQQ-binding-like beta-propeller repeat protein [Oceanicoccus sp. KOV_DT_Chl]|uniref:outer membrane protein assembly factor BamB family protein n=1 Tax=Oceanicoccus sp. KOV_DT_Chl TaxID=1904639 RepID=UPI000C7A75F5|nr:PQQ-binding-like beta-propeller repeat protein [Oceanicoccus sp. KOV_DT_Chl]
MLQVSGFIPRSLIVAGLSWMFSAQADGIYSPGGWPTLHQDAGNRRAVDVRVLNRNYQRWHRLSGATVLTVPTTSPDGQTIYATTALGANNSNLHAYSINGDLLWQSSPWQNANDSVDPCAFLSSPIIDTVGDIYISDCNQLFAFKPDGVVKWVIELPAVQAEDWRAAGDHPVNALTTAAFTAEGDILGVTNFGDVIIVDRQTGDILNQPYRLPGLIPPYSTIQPLPDSLFGNGMMDPNFREWAWQLIFGGNMRSANTPAVAASGRLFVVGSGSRKGMGALYGLDLVAGEQSLTITEAFITEIGLGSGSSPALSPAEHQAYVSDEEGWLYGINTEAGSIDWKVQTKATAGAAGVGSDGTVYALQAYAPAVVAVSPAGAILWQSDFSVLAKRLPSSWLLGEPVAVGNGNPTITADAILVPVIYGYEVSLFGRRFAVPVDSTVAAIDKATGKAMADIVSLPDDSSGITAVLADGTIVSSLGAATTSALSPLKFIVDRLLPGELTMLSAVGGVQVAIPQ